MRGEIRGQRTLRTVTCLQNECVGFCLGALGSGAVFVVTWLFGRVLGRVFRDWVDHFSSSLGAAWDQDKPPLACTSSTSSEAMASQGPSPAAAAASSQSDTESVASPATVFRRDLDTVERQLRVLAGSRVRVEAEVLHINCEETFLRRQQRRLLHNIFGLKHGEDADAHPVSNDVSDPYQVRRRS